MVVFDEETQRQKYKALDSKGRLGAVERHSTTSKLGRDPVKVRMAMQWSV